MGASLALAAGLTGCGDLASQSSTTRTVSASTDSNSSVEDSSSAAASSTGSSANGGSGASSSSGASDSTGAAESSGAASGSSGASDGSDDSGKSADGGEGSDTPKAAGVRGMGAGQGSGQSYRVVSVVDGDTIKVNIDGRKETIRLIGLDTPETKKPNTPVQCYGKEASSHMQSLVQSKQVQLEADPTQSDRDRYGRLLRYVFVGGKTNVALAQIEGGFGREYTYGADYRYQSPFQSAQVAAQSAKRGLWGPPCNGFHSTDAGASASSVPAPSTPAAPAPATSVRPQAVPTQSVPTPRAPAAPRPATSAAAACTIKGNINSKGDKIAHMPGSATYAKTRISQPGERYFCSAAEAIAAGWRMAHD